MMDLTEQLWRFVLAGGVAAAVDLCGYHWVSRRFPQMGRIGASALSTTLAMAVSFLLNRHWVFPEGAFEMTVLVRFLVVTMVAAYGIQSLVIYVLSRCCENILRGEAGRLETALPKCRRTCASRGRLSVGQPYGFAEMGTARTSSFLGDGQPAKNRQLFAPSCRTAAQ